MVILPSREEECEWEGLEEVELWPENEGRESLAMRVGQSHPRLYLSFVSFLCFLFLCQFSSAEMGGGKGKSH